MPAVVEIPGRAPLTTFEAAVQEEFNVLRRIPHVPAVKALTEQLWQDRESVEALTRLHLGLRKQDACTVLDRRQWIRGAFNICVLLEVAEPWGESRKVMFRCGMPHKLAEPQYPGTVDEKTSCEAGAYVWMQEKCPDVRIPHLYGFGFSNERHYTHVHQKSFLRRLVHGFWRCVYGLLGYPLLSQYTPTATQHTAPAAYMVMEYITPSIGRTLATTWEKHRKSPAMRRNLFSGMASIMLSLARIPQPRIGSFQFHHDGTISLTNRPFFCSTAILENDGAPRTIEPSHTYTCTEPFVSDAITFHDQRFLHDPNAAESEPDCRAQMTVKTLLRAFSHRYISREHRQGPFLLQLTDLHASNIFVDDDWNVTCLIDLEWMCALPPEALDVPYWLTSRGIDEIEDEAYEEFSKVREEFMDALREQEVENGLWEKGPGQGHDLSVPQIMQKSWESKGTWFWHCVTSVNAMYVLLESHLCRPGSLPRAAEKVISQFYCEDPDGLVKRKMEDKKAYNAQLKLAFA
ncbi:hypothetical protein B0J18DRAFT_470260 [Chaetomium sp. MPI-SDFR-AT-0129]|nr:hypothetical protein B0J18DRAFT_470260 [Chaetomium sp. MPI-SDFR-AT-0129]